MTPAPTHERVQSQDHQPAGDPASGSAMTTIENQALDTRPHRLVLPPRFRRGYREGCTC